MAVSQIQPHGAPPVVVWSKPYVARVTMCCGFCGSTMSWLASGMRPFARAPRAHARTAMTMPRAAPARATSSRERIIDLGARHLAPFPLLAHAVTHVRDDGIDVRLERRARDVGAGEDL